MPNTSNIKKAEIQREHQASPGLKNAGQPVRGSARMPVTWVSLGAMAYDQALDRQMRQAQAVLEGDDSQTVYFVEHPPTITIGRNGTSEHILAPKAYLEQQGFSVYEVDRGGDVTYHGPGQAVLYPVLHLAPWGNDVGRYVRMLEQCAMTALSYVGIRAERLEGYPGAWVGDNKICAIGARVKRRIDSEFVTSHGLALNVNPNLGHFSTIIPCGIQDKGVTSVARELGKDVEFSEWEKRLKDAFAEVFEVEV